MKITLSAETGFSPQLMRAAVILRMSAASLAQFLAHHNNPCLVPGGLPPPAAEQEDIRRQLHAVCRDASPGGERPLLEWLIECVNDDGFLELPDELPLPAAQMEAGIARLQALAPAGVAARTAQERMLLLLRHTAAPSPAARRAEALITGHWQWLARKRWDKLPKRGLTDALALIESLPPADVPAVAAAPSLPDVMLAHQRGLWRAQPAAGCKISAAARKTAGCSLNDWRRAGEIVSAVAARRRWALAAAQHAADHQSGFLRDGVAALRPLPMREAAAAMGISQGMLSHVIHGKRIISAAGEIPLKYLYGSHTQSAVIQHSLQQMMTSEDPRRPLSDEALRLRLKARGVSIARRTVAKHRLQAGIRPAALRKRVR